MIHFFSNHKDTSFIEQHLNDSVEVIPHPYIEPEWTVDEIKARCADVIDRAVQAEWLIINGDYTIVSIIVISRYIHGKKTGFLCMKKFNEPSTEKDAEGRIIHRNVLKPIGIRWV